MDCDEYSDEETLFEGKSSQCPGLQMSSAALAWKNEGCGLSIVQVCTDWRDELEVPN